LFVLAAEEDLGSRNMYRQEKLISHYVIIFKNKCHCL